MFLPDICGNFDVFPRQTIDCEHDSSEPISRVHSIQAAAIILLCSCHLDEVSKWVTEDEVLITSLYYENRCMSCNVPNANWNILCAHSTWNYLPALDDHCQVRTIYEVESEFPSDILPHNIDH